MPLLWLWLWLQGPKDFTPSEQTHIPPQAAAIEWAQNPLTNASQ
jgi:hypothetical protein